MFSNNVVETPTCRWMRDRERWGLPIALPIAGVLLRLIGVSQRWSRLQPAEGATKGWESTTPLTCAPFGGNFGRLIFLPLLVLTHRGAAPGKNQAPVVISRKYERIPGNLVPMLARDVVKSPTFSTVLLCSAKKSRQQGGRHSHSSSVTFW